MIQKDCRLAAIMYTDIVGFSKMMEADEAGTLRLLDIHNAIIEEAVAQNQGTVIKTIGDAYMVDFRTTHHALQTALTVQQKLYEYNCEHRDAPLLIRIGIHLGDIYFYENDALGDGINIAARLQSFCRPGGICFSRDVYNQVINKVEFKAEDLGVVPLKNISKEINAYEITTANVEFAPAFSRAKTSSGGTNARSNEYSAQKENRYSTRHHFEDATHRTSCCDQPITDIDQTIQSLVSFVEQKVSGIIDTADRINNISRDDYRDTRRRNRRYDDSKESYLSIGAQIRDEICNEIDISFNGHRTPHRNDLTEAEVFDHYVQHSEHRAAAAIPGFVGHLVPFLVVNYVLHHVFVATPFPWPAIVTLGWGIGIASHAAEAVNSCRIARALKKVPRLGSQSLRAFKKWQNGKSSLLRQLAGLFTIPPLLMFINRATTMFPWAMIPSGIIAISALAELIAFPFKNARAKKAFIESSCNESPVNQHVEDTIDSGTVTDDLPSYKEALQIKSDIEAQLAKIETENPEFSRLIADILVTDGQTPAEFLTDYVNQVKTTEENIHKITAVLHTVPLHSILKERSELENQRAAADSDVAAEYERAIQEIDRQRQSYKDLANHKQVLAVRIKTAVGSMTKLKLDITRIASGAGSTEKENVTQLLADRANDLRLYANDLNAGYQEADKALAP